MLRVVIVGYGTMFTSLIAAALDANCEIVGVLRKDSIKRSKYIKKFFDLVNPSKEYSYIKSYNLPEIEVKSVNSDEFRELLVKLNVDIVLVGSWGEKFSKQTYSIPKIATINAHPSLLPKYRGPNPYYWTIKNQETSSGITFHLVDENYDSGAILAQEEIKIFPSDTAQILKDRTVLTARSVACELLKDLSEDIIIPLQQNEDKATYYTYPSDFELDFNNNAESVYASIKASYPWYKTYFFHKTTAISPNPNKIYIEDNRTQYNAPGTIVGFDIRTKTIEILCNNKVIKMSDISLYKTIDSPFTKNYIKLEIKIGDII